MKKSTVYLTGAGPGDSKLVTVRALELIKKAECIIYDYLASPYLLKFADKNCKMIYAGKKGGAHTLSQDKINQLLVKQAKLYKTVVRLKGGDPFVFGRGAEEALHLKKNKINFEIVPGVTSAIAAPAYAGIPVTARSKNSTVGFITGHEDPTKKTSSINWPALTEGLGTLVFLMGVGNLPLIAKKLVECGKPKSTPVAIIRWGTTAKQEVLKGTLKNIVALAKKSKIKPPSVIVVGEVADLRKELNWFEKKPLFGKKIIVTRTRSQASVLSDQLIDLGAEVLEVPTIKIVSLKADAQIKSIFAQSAYDWIFFTSQNGVREFSEILDRIGRDSRILAGAKVCAIGSETARTLKEIGIRADYVPREFRAEAVVKHFKNKKTAPANALILRALKARNILPEGLKKIGSNVKVVNLYDTCIQKESLPALKEALKNKVDIVTFTSSSTVENFVKLLGKNYRKSLLGIKIASIGPITSQTARKLGLKVNVEAKTYTIKGLIREITKK